MYFSANLWQFCSRLSSMGIPETAECAQKQLNRSHGPGSARWALCRGSVGRCWPEGRAPAPLPRPRSPLARARPAVHRHRRGAVPSVRPPLRGTRRSARRPRPPLSGFNCRGRWAARYPALLRRCRHGVHQPVRGRAGRGGPREERLRHRSRPRHTAARAEDGSVDPSTAWELSGGHRRPCPAPCCRFSTALAVRGAPAPLRCPVCGGHSLGWQAVGPQGARACSAGPGRAAPGWAASKGSSSPPLRLRVAIAGQCSEEMPRVLGHWCPACGAPRQPQLGANGGSAWSVFWARLWPGRAGPGPAGTEPVPPCPAAGHRQLRPPCPAVLSAALSRGAAPWPGSTLSGPANCFPAPTLNPYRR